MSTFREIDERLLALVNEDGEILDVEAFEQLQVERDAKVEGMALWVLELQDEQEALKREIDRLTARKKAAEAKEKRLKEFLPAILGGAKFKTKTVSVSYRTTQAVEITDETALRDWAEIDPQGESILKYRGPEISKAALKELLTGGAEIPGAAMQTHTSTIIK